MPVCRVEKNRDYTTMSNYHLRDMELTLKAKGLLSLILSLPEDWDYTIAGLACICREGKDAVRAAVTELESAGYIQRRQTHDETGAFAGNEYVIYEAPQPPLSENPSTEKPSTENPTQLNKEIQSKEEITPLKSPAKKIPAKWKPDRFEAFWAHWPKTAGNANQKRADARRAWDRLRADDALLAYMGKYLTLQEQTEEWRKGIGIPYASTWIRMFGKDELPDMEELRAVLDQAPAPAGWAEDPEVMSDG